MLPLALLSGLFLVFCGQCNTGVQHHMDTHGISFAPPRVEVVSSLVRQDNFVPSRWWFREDGREDSKLSTGGGGRQNKYLWRSRRCETNEAWRPICRSKWTAGYLNPKENKTIQILEATRLIKTYRRRILFFNGPSWTKHRSWRTFFA